MAMVNLKGAGAEARMGLGEDHYLSLKFSLKALPSGRSFAYEEVLDDHQEKSNNFYQCRRRNWYESPPTSAPSHSRLGLIPLSSKMTFSTPSNRCKHEKKHETPS